MKMALKFNETKDEINSLFNNEIKVNHCNFNSIIY